MDWLFPPFCGGCGQFGLRWCPSCQAKVKLVGQRICIRCGNPLQYGKICERCRVSPPDFERLRSWAEFEGPIREALHRLKYQNDIGLGQALAAPLTSYFQHLKWNIDLVVPVPLGKYRKKDRGYNQVALLAHPLALNCGLIYLPNALTRDRETASQVGLSASERILNVTGAFAADPSRVSGKRVLVVDDVCTTGATIRSCAAALKQAGASAIYGLSLARAVLAHDT